MSILSANLKHLYQRRGFWFIGLFFGAVAFGIVTEVTEAIAKNKQGVFCAPALWMLLVGTFIATLPMDVLTKPFSYCLPGHRNMPRKFLFVAGLSLSFLWSLSFIFFPGLNLVKTVPACLSAFSTFAIFYWVGVWIVFTFRNWSVVLALFPLLMLGDKPLNMSLLIVHAIVESPLPMILIGGLVNYSAWSYWGRPNLARRYCGVLWMGTFDFWNKEKWAKYTRVKLAEKNKLNSMTILPDVERFFVSRIGGAKSGSLRQYIWGALYKSLGVMVSRQRQDWWKFLMLLLPMLCLLCYLPGGGKNIIFVMPGIMVVHMSLGVYSSLLIRDGRQQRFWSALTLAATTAIFVSTVVVLLVMFTNLLERVMPQLTIGGRERDFNGLNIIFSPIPLLMIPLMLTIGLVFHRKPALMILLTIVVFQILFTLIALNWRVQIGLAHIIIMLLCSWAVFIAVLRYISMRCCLVNQGK